MDPPYSQAADPLELRAELERLERVERPAGLAGRPRKEAELPAEGPPMLPCPSPWVHRTSRPMYPVDPAGQRPKSSGEGPASPFWARARLGSILTLGQPEQPQPQRRPRSFGLGQPV